MASTNYKKQVNRCYKYLSEKKFKIDESWLRDNTIITRHYAYEDFSNGLIKFRVWKNGKGKNSRVSWHAVTFKNMNKYEFMKKVHDLKYISILTDIIEK